MLITLMKKLQRRHKSMIPGVLIIMTIIFVSPAINAINERSFLY